jgi:hypothetical protein
MTAEEWRLELAGMMSSRSARSCSILRQRGNADCV